MSNPITTLTPSNNRGATGGFPTVSLQGNQQSPGDCGKGLNDIPFEFCNSQGSLRLSFVRKFYGLETETIGSYVDKKTDKVKLVNVKVQTKKLTSQDIEDITRLYVSWRDLDEVIPVRLTYRGDMTQDFSGLPVDPQKWCNIYNLETGLSAKVIEDSKVVYVGDRFVWKAIPSVKRGNKEYIELVKEKLDPLTKQKPLVFFSTVLNSDRKINRKTNLLYVTGTINQDLFDGLADAWLKFGKLWNDFITNLRQQFNGAEYIRAWQSQENGYPHFHALIWLPFDFSAVPSWEFNKKTGKRDHLRWRVSSRQKLHKGDDKTVLQRLKGAWKWGYADVICVSDIKQAFKDELKYITRDLEGGESDLTNAMVWFFGKQSYSVSKNFVGSVFGKDVSIGLAEPTNADLIKGFSRSNSNSVLIRIEIFPSVLKKKLHVFYQSKLDEWLSYQSLPPPAIDYFEKMSDSCKPSKVIQHDIFDENGDPDPLANVEVIIYEWDNMGGD